jgi:hypothetical protein
VVQFKFVHGLPDTPDVGVVQMKTSVDRPCFRCVSVAQAIAVHAALPLVGAVQYLKSCLALKAKAPPTTANTLKDRSINFTLFIKKVLFKIKKLNFNF